MKRPAILSIPRTGCYQNHLVAGPARFLSSDIAGSFFSVTILLILLSYMAFPSF